jgi:ATP-dependent DNA ligase
MINAASRSDSARLRRLRSAQAQAAPRRVRAPPQGGGIFAASFEQGEIGHDLFEVACNMGLEALVSKRADRPYRAGRSKDWIKIKNRQHPAYRRISSDPNHPLRKRVRLHQG